MRASVGAASLVLFKGGEGCGACYKFKCVDKGLCSEKPVTIMIMDACRGGDSAFGSTHFDLSGAAFGRMATDGKTPMLLNSRELSVLYRRYNTHKHKHIWRDEACDEVVGEIEFSKLCAVRYLARNSITHCLKD